MAFETVVGKVAEVGDIFTGWGCKGYSIVTRVDNKNFYFKAIMNSRFGRYSTTESSLNLSIKIFSIPKELLLTQLTKKIEIIESCYKLSEEMKLKAEDEKMKDTFFNQP
jgi:hypothetical protein